MGPFIPFNNPYISPRALQYIEESLTSGHLSGNGPFTKRCHSFLEDYFGAPRVLLTSSCTDALEMSALLLNIQPGDEFILPDFTFVSTANAFVLRGAIPRFVDSRPDHPGMDESKIEELINPRTKAIVVVHYAGVAVDMDPVMALSAQYGIPVVEDAAHAIGATYKGRKLGSIAPLATLSFHETKNIHCGEGGALIINDSQYAERAEILWEKGTNRNAFARGEVSKYEWVDIGSSFLPSDVTAALLLAHLEELEEIQARRVAIWDRYYELLEPSFHEGTYVGPHIPGYASNNAHMFYVVCRNAEQRVALLERAKDRGVGVVFHYQSLGRAKMPKIKSGERQCINSYKYSLRLIRYPLFHRLIPEEAIERVRLNRPL